ncbi:hypothetical protein SARC_11093 [Sphaeroforma arctica JP610]|uniref:Lipase-like C-terminal domain-containing protein n=1 Tax=Sphaeroforma arctica JP610 TaxID=667725 RepID=A0A0L0FI15_9EUKA|nr:hypothetical protein SARC_11093 [Sphaeroforma arctica JP610]KNC76405.1 hypothetical protein SARC_11093 [Sphaeroforma arctica JP610]|eukprot:XP_014150307.1 hypothetical protein SARC_11093 [Sphaeroforma arctica JP610]
MIEKIYKAPAYHHVDQSESDCMKGKPYDTANEICEPIVPDAPDMSVETAINMANTLRTTLSSSSIAPVVLIPGFLMSGEFFWFDALSHHSKIIAAQVGGASSLHDRACELFYQLVGGRVDYGEEHSKTCGHSRYGATFEKGLHPQFSAENPIHLIGYSFGGPTARVFQQYLHEKRFTGYSNTDASWVRSLTTVCAPHNGTTAAHSVGGLRIGEQGVTKPFRTGWLATKLVHAYDWLDISFLKDRVFHPRLEHWGYQRRNATSLWDSLSKLATTMYKSPLVAPHGDNAGDDLSPAKMMKINKTMEDTFPCTYYLSFTAQSTTGSRWWSRHLPSCFSFMWLSSAVMATRKYTTEQLQMMYAHADFGSNEKLGILREGLYANDGLVNVASQGHPGLCFNHPSRSRLQSEILNELVLDRNPCPVTGKIKSTESKCVHRHSLAEHIAEEGTLSKGKWYVSDLLNYDHVTLLTMPTCRKRTSAFFMELYECLRMLPESLQLVEDSEAA